MRHVLNDQSLWHSRIGEITTKMRRVNMEKIQLKRL